MDKNKIIFIREYKRHSLKAHWENWDVAHDNQYLTGMDRSLWLKLTRRGHGDFLLRRELNEKLMKNRKLIVVCEHFRYHPRFLMGFLHRTYPDKHLLYWLRNTLFAEQFNTGLNAQNIKEFLALQNQYHFHVISFDKGDCAKYGLLYAPQCIDFPGFEDALQFEAPYTIQQDVIWLGKDKGRVEKLKTLKDFLDKHQISYQMQIVAEDDKIYDSTMIFALINHNVPYKQYLQDVLHSRAIIDFYQKGQNGLSIRPIEAMRLKKKLITDYQDIDTYDFYRKENIFIMGKDRMEDLPYFLHSPYEDIPEETIQQYSTVGMIQSVYQQLNWDLGELE